MATGYSLTSLNHSTPIHWGNPVTGPIIKRMKIKNPEVFRSRIVARLLVNHPERVPLQLLRIMVAAATLPGVDQASYTMLRNVTILRGWRSNLMLLDDLVNLQVATLFLWGDSDKFALPHRGQEIAARMPHAQIKVIPDAGHVLYLEWPDIVAADIIGFLRQSD